MAFTGRELLIVLRARDEASRVIRTVNTNLGALNRMQTVPKGATADQKALIEQYNNQVRQQQLLAQQYTSAGQGLVALGSSAIVAGGLTTKFFSDSTKDAQNYNKQVALTQTQTRDLGITFEELQKIGKSTSSAIPVDFLETQQGLYDIFSTIDVSGAAEAESVLQQLSKASVAGDADLRTVARTSLATMNAWGVGAEGLGEILDTQQLIVNYGAGELEEFSAALGKGIPTAKAAGQEFRTYAGIVTFLTKQGLNANRAVTATQRGIELLGRPKNFKALKKIGVDVFDPMTGSMRQADDILYDLAYNAGWAKMSDKDRKQAFADIFGLGTPKAREFFDAVISNMDDFIPLMDEFQNDANAMEKAYDIMFKDPANQAQLLSNKYKEMKTEIGDALIPAKLKLMQTIMRLLDWWNGLDEGTRSLIVKFVAITGAIITVIGVVTTLLGIFFLFKGALLAAGITMTMFAGITLGMIAAIAAVIAIGYLLYKNWDTVKAILLPIWDAIKAKAIEAFEYFQTNILPKLIEFKDSFIRLMQELWAFIQPILETIVTGVRAFIDTWKSGTDEITASGFVGFMQQLAVFIRDTVIPTLIELGTWLFNTGKAIAEAAIEFGVTAYGYIQDFWTKIQEVWGWLSSTFGPGIIEIWNTLKEEGQSLWEATKEFIGFMKEEWDKFKQDLDAAITFVKALWDGLFPYIKAVWDLISGLISAAIKFIGDVIRVGFNLIWDNIKAVWEFIKDTIKAAWTFIVALATNGIRLLSNVIQLVMNIIRGNWSGAWNNILAIFRSINNMILATGRFLMTMLWNIIKLGFRLIIAGIKALFGLFFAAGKLILRGLWSGIKAVWALTAAWFRGLPGKIKGFFSGAGSWLVSIGKSIISGLIRGIVSKFSGLKSSLSGLKSKITSWKGPPAVDKKLLIDNGKLIMQGLETGLVSGYSNVKSTLQQLTTQAKFMPNVSLQAQVPKSIPYSNNLSDDPTLKVIDLLEQLLDKFENPIGNNIQGDVIISKDVDADDLDFWSKGRGI